MLVYSNGMGPRLLPSLTKIVTKEKQISKASHHMLWLYLYSKVCIFTLFIFLLQVDLYTEMH